MWGTCERILQHRRLIYYRNEPDNRRVHHRPALRAAVYGAPCAVCHISVLRARPLGSSGGYIERCLYLRRRVVARITNIFISAVTWFDVTLNRYCSRFRLCRNSVFPIYFPAGRFAWKQRSGHIAYNPIGGH